MRPHTDSVNGGEVSSMAQATKVVSDEWERERPDEKPSSRLRHRGQAKHAAETKGESLERSPGWRRLSTAKDRPREGGRVPASLQGPARVRAAPPAGAHRPVVATGPGLFVRAGGDTQAMHVPGGLRPEDRDRKSTRLNSSHANISYAVF